MSRSGVSKVWPIGSFHMAHGYGCRLCFLQPAKASYFFTPQFYLRDSEVIVKVAESQKVGGFGWSRTPKNTGSPTEWFFLHHIPKLSIPTRACWNDTISFQAFIETILADCKLPNFIHVMLKSLESDILPLTPQPWSLYDRCRCCKPRISFWCRVLTLMCMGCKAILCYQNKANLSQEWYVTPFVVVP